jgi:hypothetical protein
VLKIPRSLFLISKPPPNNRQSPQRQHQRRRAGEERGGERVLGGQAEEMARLMRRSVVLHEFKERVRWGEDLDPHAASEERV